MQRPEKHSIYGGLVDFEAPLIPAHNPKVTGSSPVPATSKNRASRKCEAFFYFLPKTYLKQDQEQLLCLCKNCG